MAGRIVCGCLPRLNHVENRTQLHFATLNDHLCMYSHCRLTPAMQKSQLAAALLHIAGAYGTSDSTPSRLESRQARPSTYAAHTIDQPVRYFHSCSNTRQAHSNAIQIDHAQFHNDCKYEPHTNATFKQRYFFDDTYYQAGGPVFLYIGGETSGESRFSNLETGIIQIRMNATNGLGIILENRYYGESYPYNSSTTDELRFLTTDQTIADNEYFAKHAVFPGVNGSLSPADTPWILYGGSLAGAQTAFSLKTYPGTLWGGIASSGTSLATLGAETWFDPYQKFGPQDCIGSLNAIVDKIDEVFESGNVAHIAHMKSIFGLQDLTNLDFAQAIAYPLGNPGNYPTSTWQELNWHPAYSSDDIFLFCTNITNANAPENITSTDYTLAPYTRNETWTNLGNYANYIKSYLTPATCEANQTIIDCYAITPNTTSYIGSSANNAGRSYLYSTCTEQGAYLAARQNSTQPSLLSRIVTPAYQQQWCTWAFPAGTHNKIPSTPDLDAYNKFGGNSVIADRLAHIDGEQDVWLPLCYHADSAPKRFTRNATDAYLHPQLLITGGGHHWDSYGILDVEAEPSFIREAHHWEIRVVKKWIEMFDDQKKGT